MDDVKENKTIWKYFWNNHFSHAKYEEAGGSVLNLPQDVLLNTLADCPESYFKTWPILYMVCSNNKVIFNKDIIKLLDETDSKEDGRTEIS